MRRFFLWIFFVLIIIGASCASLNKFQKSGQSIANKKQEAFNSTAAQHFIRGSINELRGDYKSAHLEYSQALLYDSSSATIYNKITEQYIRMKNIESAKKMLLITEKRFPTNISTHKILASIFFSEQQWKKAEQELRSPEYYMTRNKYYCRVCEDIFWSKLNPEDAVCVRCGSSRITTI